MSDFYSIWLVPSEPVYSKVKEIINLLSKKYDGPSFEPHITLLGDIEMPLLEIIIKTKKLAKSIKPFKLTSGTTSFGTTYFLSTFLRVNPRAKLQRLNLDTQNLIGKTKNTFIPHISLLYGNQGMTVRQNASSEIKLPETTFEVSEFTITPATMDPSEWKHVAVIPFD